MNKEIKEYLKKTNQLNEKPIKKEICFICGKETNRFKDVIEITPIGFYFYYCYRCYKKLIRKAFKEK